MFHVRYTRLGAKKLFLASPPRLVLPILWLLFQSEERVMFILLFSLSNPPN